MKTILTSIIKGYQRFISPMCPPTCRFEPTCSEYSLVAIARFGVFRGLWLGVVRLLKCQPFHQGGFDPVPTMDK